ncbi:hypothetical protein [Pseudomonas sp. BNK-15]|uniref:hypothetical protein n=1 Tax=Pseudomonas sp. BNK-15 TaxID=3376152 RepID=UPI0039C0002E
MNPYAEAQQAIEAAQKRVDELMDAQKFLDAEREVARLALRNAHAALQRLKSSDSRLQSNARKAELDSLRDRLAAAQGGILS